MNKQTIKDKIEKLNAQLKEIEAKELAEKNTGDWFNLKNRYEINTKQQFNGKTYDECVKLAKQNNWIIADYPLLQKLRNDGLEFLKDFWVFVPNPDKISEKNYVSRFGADSVRAGLDCGGCPAGAGSSLGVFVLRKKVNK